MSDQDSSEEDNNNTAKIGDTPVHTTREGRILRAPNWHKDYAVLALTNAKIGHQTHLKEVAMAEMYPDDYRIHREASFVGTGLGGGFENTAELKVMKYNEVM